MNDQVATIFIVFLYVLIGLVIARSLMTWFTVRQDNQFARFLFLDLTPMILILVLYVMIYAVGQAASS
jgi:hypothetical protein